MRLGSKFGFLNSFQDKNKSNVKKIKKEIIIILQLRIKLHKTCKEY